MPSEKQIQKQITDYLKQLDGCWYYVTTGNLRGRNGVPDILVFYQGIFYGLEVKKPGNKASKLQDYELQKINKAGGVGAVVYSLADVKKIFASNKTAD